MKFGILKLLLLVFLMILSGCSKPPGVIVSRFDFNESDLPSSWKKIVVLPFSGDKKFQRPVAEWFAFHLQGQPYYSIVTPAFAEIEIRKQGMEIPDSGYSIEQARQAARILGADAVILGEVETERRSQSPVIIRIQLIDFKTGKQVATSSTGYPSTVVIWDNYYEYVKRGTDKVGRDFKEALQGLATGKWVAPPPDSLPTE